MLFHVHHPTGAICGATEDILLSKSVEVIDCPNCLELIRKAGQKAHQRRRKFSDSLIIYKALTGNNKPKLSKDDYESYRQRYSELTDEIEQLNPDNDKEAYLMGMLESEVHYG